MWLGGAAVRWIWWIKELLNSHSSAQWRKTKLQQCFHFTVCPPPPFFYFYFTPQFLLPPPTSPPLFANLVLLISPPHLPVQYLGIFLPHPPHLPPLSLSILFFFFFSSRMLSQLSLF